MFTILYEEFAVYVLYLLVLLNKPLVWKGLVLCTNVCYELAGAEVLVSSARQRREEEAAGESATSGGDWDWDWAAVRHGNSCPLPGARWTHRIKSCPVNINNQILRTG